MSRSNVRQQLTMKKTTSLELGYLMAKLEQIDKKLKCSEEDRQMLKKEIRYNKNENWDNCFSLARATEEKIQQMSDKVEATNKEREKHIKKDMQEMKQRYDTVNEKLWNLETRMDKMSRDQAENSCAIHSKLDALLRISTAQDKLVADRPQGTRVDFIEPQRNKRESTPLPRIATSTGAGGSKDIMKGGTSSTTNARENSITKNNVAPDAMTWASTWEMINRTLEAFATRKTDSSEIGSGKSRKTFKKPKEFKEDSDGCIDTWVEVMRLYLEQDNLNDERQACTAILSYLEGTALKYVVAKKEKERDTAEKIFEILLNGFGSGMKGHQAMMRFEKRRQRDDLESLKRRSDPEESTNSRSFGIASKFIDGVKSDDLRTMLATYYTLSKDNVPTPEEMGQKFREYMLMKPKKYSRINGSSRGASTTYKQGMKSLGYAPDGEEISQTEEQDFYSGLIIKIGARYFFCNQEGHFRMDCPLFWEAVKNQNHPKHKN